MSHDEHLVTDVVVDFVVDVEGFLRLLGGILRIFPTGGEAEQGVCQITSVPIFTFFATANGLLEQLMALIGAVVVGVKHTHVVASLSIVTKKFRVGSLPFMRLIAVVFIAWTDDGIGSDALALMIRYNRAQQSEPCPLGIIEFLLFDAVQAHLCAVGFCRQVSLGSLQLFSHTTRATAKHGNQPSKCQYVDDFPSHNHFEFANVLII